MTQAVLDRSDSRPLYQQLRSVLREQIVVGVWAAGEMLPTEQQICEIHGVSRTTARAAVEDLVREGLLYREQGRGTFVARAPQGETHVQSLRGFHQDMTARGHSVASEILTQGIVPASSWVANQLQVPPGVSVIHLSRLHRVNGELVSKTDTYLPYALCPDLLQADMRDQSLYAWLERTYGYRVARAKRTVEARALLAETAALLGAPEGMPSLYIESTTCMTDGTPLEFYEAWHRGDKSKFEVDVVAEESE